MAGDWHVEEDGLVAFEAGGDAVGELVGLGDAVGLDAEAAGKSQVVELRADEIAAFELLLLGFGQAEAAAAKLQDLILSVVADDEDDGNLVAGGRPEALNAVGGGAFTEQGEYRSIGPGELRADGNA